MKKNRSIHVILLLTIILGFSTSNTTAQPSAPVISIFDGNMTVLRDKPSALLVKNLILLANYSQELKKAGEQSVILYEGSLNELSETLNITNAPKVRTETTTVILSAYYKRNGKILVGQILVPKSDPNQDRDPAYIDFVNLILEKADKYGGLLRVPQTINNYFNTVYLPVISFSRSAYWDPMPILVTTVLDCHWGKYNDVIVGQKVVGEDN